MTFPVLLLLLSPAIALFCAVLAPASVRNSRPVAARIAVTATVGWLFVMAVVAAACRLLGVIDPIAELRWPPVGPVACGVYLDGVSSLALVLVSFVGLVVCRYSVRYLDGDSRQGDYFRWVAATIGSVSLLVLSGNLLMLVAAWVGTSLSLHRLLLHFPSRPGAQKAAWRKFAISRAGDLFLVAALVLVYREFATFDLSVVFAAIGPSAESSVDRSNTLAWLGWLIVAAAITKSAQFPLHTWLPDTLETPTPVSALMHAGVVNAGGYLIIRLSSLVVQAPNALIVLAVVGLITALFGSIVMMTQTSVKKMLAYSTVAQMGFMMLQCGLGAFSAAMLHLVAHSLYKAYAFLNSGNVLREAHGAREPERVEARRQDSLATSPIVAGAVLIGFGAIALLLGFDIASKPGGYALAGAFCVAMTVGIIDSLRSRRDGMLPIASLAALVMAVCYLIGYLAINQLVGPYVAHPPIGLSEIWKALLVGAAFLGLAALQALMRSMAVGRFREALYVHALNGFYTDAIVTRVTGHLALRK